MSKPRLRGIVSGGQTGVDRAALVVGRERRIPLGGWCPAGRWAEDGPISKESPLHETPSADPAQRTSWNVFDSDATLILCRGELRGGTSLAAHVAERFRRPLLIVRDETDLPALDSWLTDRGPTLLNVAGPRESEDPGVTRWAGDLLAKALADVDVERSADRVAVVTGGAGYLGRHLLELTPPFWRVVGTARSAAGRSAEGDLEPLELSEAGAVLQAFRRLEPALVIHTAYSLREPQRDIVEATRAVAEAAAAVGADLIHISTDMVLDGTSGPFDEHAPAEPVHEYGRFKALAEHTVREVAPDASIVRASLMTRFDPPDPRTEWVLGGLRGDHPVTLFVDEIRSPILVHDVARQIWEIARIDRKERSGVWNLAAPEALSRYALGTLIAAAHGLSPAPLQRAFSADSPQPRPRDLRLLTRRADLALLTRARLLSAAVGDSAGAKK